MTDYTKNTIVSKAKAIKKNVEQSQELGLTNKWLYYICKSITSPKTSNFKGIKIADAKRIKGDSISRQIFKSSYMDMAERIIRYTERENQLPATVGFTSQSGKTYRVNIDVATDMFSRILVYLNKNQAYPKYANINSKCFDKPTETGNEVYDYWVKVFGFKPKSIDEVCDYIRDHFTYEFYYDDQKSNKEVIDSKAGNCTDLSQMAVNMGIAMDYEWRAIHTQCKQSGTGHIYPQFKKGNTGWITRDVACISDESRYCVWCDVDEGRGYLLATNPAWFLQNLRR